MGRPALPPELVARVTSLRLTPAYRAALDALVDDENRRLGEPGAVDQTELLRGLIVEAFHARRLSLPPGTPGAEVFEGSTSPRPAAPPAPAPRRAAPAAPPPPAPPQLEGTAQIYATLDRLAGGDTQRLVHVIQLVRESGLPVEVAHAALKTLARRRDVELRPDTSPDLRRPEDEALYPITAAGVIGYVRLKSMEEG